MYYGLNSYASIFINFGYGILDNLSFSLGHGNINHEWELSLKWLLLNQETYSSLPVSIAFVGGSGFITEPVPCEHVWRSENFKLNFQLSISHQLNNSVSLLIVPGYSSNTNIADPLSENTFALGTGCKYEIINNFSVIGEWVPVIYGFKENNDGWGMGVEYKTAGHVFQIFISNCYGIITDQYLPGGDLELSENEYRLGFNLFRTFWF